jgi:exosome complex protein LRP1
MDAPELTPLLQQLDDNIDDLEEALAPVLAAALSETAGKLPLLDKARLNIVVTYAIESILFSKTSIPKLLKHMH